jgi:hypothetical protein
MSDERPAGVMVIEAREELMQHIERGGRIIRGLSILTIVVASLLSVLYLYQIALPYAFGMTQVTVDLLAPSNIALESILIVLALLWLYVGVRDYLFVSRLSKSIREIRAAEKEIEKRITS